MTTYFEVDRKKELVMFKNTDQLALLICGVVEGVRKLGSQISEQVGKEILAKTPGKKLVQLAVRLVLYDNAFHYGRCRMYYPGYFGPKSEIVNALINSKLGGVVPPTDLAAMAVQSLMATLLERAGIPEAVIKKTAMAVGCAVSVGIKHGEAAHVERAGKVATHLISNADAGIEMVRLMRQNPPRPGDYIAVDTAKNLIRFTNADKLAIGINLAITQLRSVAAGIPEVGPALGSYVKANTPGKTLVNQLVGFLDKNAFNYEQMHFEYQGGAFASNRVINWKLNGKLDAVLSVSNLVEQCIAHGVEELYMRHISNPYMRAAISKAIAAPLSELIQSKTL